MEIQTMNPIEIERAKINQIDRSIIELLDRRFEVVRTIAEIKTWLGMPVFQAGREQEVLERVSSLSQNSDFMAEIFKKIMEESKKFQEALKWQIN